MRLIRLIVLLGTFIGFTAEFLYAQWVATNGPIEGITYSLALEHVAADGAVLFGGTWNGGVFRSSDNGDTWIEIDGGNWKTLSDTGFTHAAISLLATIPNLSGGSALFAVDVRGALFRSIESDSNWTAIKGDVSNRSFNTLITTGNYIFGGTDSGVVISTDLGSHWNVPMNELSSSRISSLLFVGNGIDTSTLFSATSAGIYRSTNMGVNWALVNGGALGFVSMAAMQEPTGHTLLFAIRSSTGDMLRSSDFGISWVVVSDSLDPFTHISLQTIAVQDTIIYADGTTGFPGTNPVMCFSLTRGNSWIRGDLGLGQRPVHMFLSDGKNLFAATPSDVGKVNSVWRRPLSEMVTDVKVSHGQIYPDLKLEQNYPNPFNPSTTIRYEMSIQGHVLLRVYDELGQEVVTLVNENQSAGIHNVTWDASGQSSGIYFCRLTSGESTRTSKMAVLK